MKYGKHRVHKRKKPVSPITLSTMNQVAQIFSLSIIHLHELTFLSEEVVVLCVKTHSAILTP